MISDALDLGLLRTYVLICQHGSLSRAAQRAGRAQSALSTQLRRLETMVGKRLLHRTGRGVSPTTEGEMLLGYANRILALGEAAAAQLSGRAATTTLRIGLSEDVAIAALPAALGRLRRTCPELHLDVVVDEGTSLASRWHEGMLDVAIGPNSAFQGDPVQTWEVDLHWVRGIDEQPDPARPLDVIAYAEPCAWRRLMFNALAIAGREFRVTLTTHNVGATIAAVENGLGVALLTAECIRPDTMRTLSLAADGSADLSVQYGLYASPRAGDAGRTAIALLGEGLRSWTSVRPPLELGRV